MRIVLNSFAELTYTNSMRAGRNQVASTGDLTFAVLTIWLILFAIAAPPLLMLATFVLGPLPLINRIIIDLVYTFFALLIISFCVRRRYPGLIWLPAIAVAALAMVFLFGV